MNNLSKKQSLLGISIISMATLMFELVANKALAFSTWGSLGYMIIGSAIFGFSIAGVVIAIWQPHKKYPLNILLSYASFIFACTVISSYLVMNIIPFNFENILTNTATQILYFSTWYISLLIPFSMTGFIVALLLISFKKESNRLYAADLVGAGLGCAVVVPLFPLFGAAGQYFLCAALGTICTIIFAWKKLLKIKICASIFLVIFVILSFFMQSIYPVKVHQQKRSRAEHYSAGYIKYSMWSFLSKIEAAIIPNSKSGMLWFDGGRMQSAIDRFDGNYKKATIPSIQGAYSIAYKLKPRKNVLIIAPAGGRELRTALANNAEKVTAVELDYSVERMVRNELDSYLGGIFNDPRVVGINDEGRSFVHRSLEKYDVIQFISAYSVTAIQSGAVNLASSYLITEEAFNDYLDHLTQDGVLSIARDLNLRLFFTAWNVLEKRGLDPSERIVLLKGGSLGRNTLLLKLMPFSANDLKIIKQVSVSRKIDINYAPAMLMSSVDKEQGLISEPKTRNIIEQFINVPIEKRELFYAKFPYRVSPVQDDNPFFNNIRYIFRNLHDNPELLTEEVEEFTNKTWYIPHLPIGYIARVVVLIEAVVIAALFLIFPLWKFKSEGIKTNWQRFSMFYFFSLGLGFIWVEITLLKTFILFLGSPVYSISVVLFSMLISAGIGSFYSEKLKGSLKSKLVFMSIMLTLVFAVLTFAYPMLFQLFLGYSLPLRIFIALILISPIGLVLGMPFPIGLEYLSAKNTESIAWAWAVNGYATVIGVATSAFIAMNTGFTMLLWLSFGVYLLGFLSLNISHRNWLKS